MKKRIAILAVLIAGVKPLLEIIGLDIVETFKQGS